MKLPGSVRALLAQIGRLAETQGVSAYAVGGCVRDWCLGKRDVVDVDITVEGDGVVVAQAVAQAFTGTLRTHPQFGTATVILGKRPTPPPTGTPGPSDRSLVRGQVRRMDVVTCRQETYAKPAAYPKVTRGTLQDDLFRRDFTFNAMAVALNPGRFGTLVDPFGGKEDLRRRRVRILHPRSFMDDPSRILRGIRFASRFACRFDKATAHRAREAVRAGALGWLNAGRLGRELERMLQEPNPLACFQQLAELCGDRER